MELNCHTGENITVTVTGTEKYWVHTDKGKLLDTMCGNTAFIFGYDNNFILDRMYQQQKQLSYLSAKHTELCATNNDLVDKLCKEGNFAGVSYAISGTDGVECAYAMNELYWQLTDKSRFKVVTFSPGYHGSTFLCRAFRGEESLPEFVTVLDAPQWNTLKERPAHEAQSLVQLKQTLESDPQIGAVIMESIPWAMGIKPWSAEWWKYIRAICTEYNVNLIIDDVMGGMGKLGYKFSHTRYGIQPDLVALGKAFTGGFNPLSCVCASEKISETVKNNWNYGHTWQPNMGGVGAALAVWDLLDSSKLLEIEQRLDALGKHFVSNGLATEYVAVGLIFSMKLITPITIDSFVQNGLTGGPESKHSISLCAPAIADDEYFEELKNRITHAIQNSQ
jgi:adenosylmethionine-8-amino-7-oxononanoate aminotransferase